MPIRKTLFINGEYYHLFNRTINKEHLFTRDSDCKRFLITLSYYQYINPPLRLSYFLSFGYDKRQEINSRLEKSEKLAEIISFCLMPNHYHLLLKQVAENGISNFARLFQNSFTRYFNTKHTRSGYLFEGQFKAVRIEDNEQLLHLNRYIHINPYVSFVVKSFGELEAYPYSSLPEYLDKRQSNLSNKEIILPQFPNLNSYKQFIFDEADYRKTQKLIQHLTFE